MANSIVPDEMPYYESPPLDIQLAKLCICIWRAETDKFSTYHFKIIFLIFTKNKSKHFIQIDILGISPWNIPLLHEEIYWIPWNLESFSMGDVVYRKWCLWFSVNHLEMVLKIMDCYMTCNEANKVSSSAEI